MKQEMPIKMLIKDHRNVEKLFADCHKKRNPAERAEIVNKIVKELEVHMELEEKLFYPKVESFSEEGRKLVKHGRGEHEELKKIARKLKNISETSVDDNENLRQMEKIKNDHVMDEEKEMFPFAEKNLKDELGMMFSAKMMALKEKLKLEK